MLSVLERAGRVLADGADRLAGVLRPAAAALGPRLNVPAAAAALLPEEAVRAGCGAPLAQLVAALQPKLRVLAGVGDWQIVSRGRGSGAVSGRVVCVARLAEVQYETYAEPVVLVANRVSGEEEIPQGALRWVCWASGCPPSRESRMISC